MKYRKLGRTGLEVSEIGFGSWAIGGTSYGPTDDIQSLQALEAAWQGGVNFFDTADTYGHGHSEELLARFFKGKERSKFILASKAGWDFYHGGNKKNFKPEYIRFACDESLKRLNFDFIDLYQLHNPSLELILNGEPVSILDDLKKQGKIRFIGISVHSEEDALAAIGDPRVDTVQLIFNLLDQKMLEKVFPLAQEKNIAVIVREPLACGILTGKYKAGHKFVKTDHRNRWTEEKLELELEKISKIKNILSTERLSLSRAALEFVLDQEAVSTVIPGAKTATQVEENLKSSNDPQLRIQESFHLKEIYQREEIFKRK